MGFHPDWNVISGLIQGSERIFIKKLSRNDSSWADSSENGHQNGFFIPREIAESSYFPELRNSNPDKPHILDCEYPTLWPASGEVKTSKIKYFSLRNPGDKEKERPRHERQHTGVPKEQFQSLSPASLLVGGSFKIPVSGASYWFVVIDSASQEAEIVEAGAIQAAMMGLDRAQRTASPAGQGDGTQGAPDEIAKLFKDTSARQEGLRLMAFAEGYSEMANDLYYVDDYYVNKYGVVERYTAAVTHRGIVTFYKPAFRWDYYVVLGNLVHEHVHWHQYRTLGPVRTPQELARREIEAYGVHVQSRAFRASPVPYQAGMIEIFREHISDFRRLHNLPQPVKPCSDIAGCSP